MKPVYGWFKKMQQGVTFGAKIQTMTRVIYLSNIEVLEISKFLSNNVFKITFSATFQYKLCYNTLIIIANSYENKQKLYRYLCNLTYTKT